MSSAAVEFIALKIDKQVLTWENELLGFSLACICKQSDQRFHPLESGDL